jgi:hypothetical protein
MKEEKRMRVIVRNYETGEVIYETSMKIKGNLLKDAIKEIEKQQEESDVLKLGKAGALKHTGFGLGIKSIYESGSRSSSRDLKEEDALHSTKEGNIVSTTTAKNQNNTDEAPEPLEFRDGTTTNVRVSVYSYAEGFLINTGKTVAGGLFGLGKEVPAYLQKITSRQFVSGEEGYAKAFDCPKKIEKYVEDKKHIFVYLADKNGYNFSVAYASKDYKKQLMRSDDKKTKKLLADFDLVNQYLETEINVTSDDEVSYDDIPSEATDEIITEEAVKRLRSFGVMKEVVDNFNKGVLMMSEGAGFLYTLDENAKKAVEEAEKRNFKPYHVIHSSTEFGELYDVLYVSKNTGSWTYERLNQKTDEVMSYCYNWSGDFGEVGTILAKGRNGGMKRYE